MDEKLVDSVADTFGDLYIGLSGGLIAGGVVKTVPDDSVGVIAFGFGLVLITSGLLMNYMKSTSVKVEDD